MLEAVFSSDITLAPIFRRPGFLSRYSGSLRAGRFGDRFLVEARFSAPVQTVPGAHPAPYTMCTESFPGVKRPGRGVYNPPPSSAEVKERAELYLYSPSGPSWPLPLPLPISRAATRRLNQRATVDQHSFGS
jgi:hypothetical protein